MDLYSANFSKVLKKAQLDLNEWGKINVSWFGRTALLKMVTLPRFLHIIQCLPISLPASFFRRVQKDVHTVSLEWLTSAH